RVFCWPHHFSPSLPPQKLKSSEIHRWFLSRTWVRRIVRCGSCRVAIGLVCFLLRVKLSFHWSETNPHSYACSWLDNLLILKSPDPIPSLVRVTISKVSINRNGSSLFRNF